MKFLFGLLTAVLAQSNISFQSEMGLMNSMESEEGGTFDGGFDINDYVNEQTNPYFLELAHNISLANGGGANHRIRGAGRNELAPIDFAELQRKDAMMMTTTRKFKHVAGLVMFLQAVPILGKYVYYGCYCFSDAQYKLDAGHGKPVDAIDSACKRFHQCYACVKKDFVEEKQQVKIFLVTNITMSATAIIRVLVFLTFEFRIIAMAQVDHINSKVLSIQ